jgi:hypothetical protein
MNTKVCPKCGRDNAAQMKFCSNCGQSLPDQAATNYQEDPPPTVFMGQPPPRPQNPPIPPPQQQSPFDQPQQQNRQNPPFQQSASNNPFNQPVAPNAGFGQSNAPNNPQFSIPAPPPQPPKKSNKGLIFGAIGCLGLLVLSLFGAGIAGLIFYNSSSTTLKSDYPSPTPYSSNSFVSNSSKDTTTSDDNSTTGTDSSTLLTTILESRKTVGSFNQTDVKSVVASEYFPEGTGAAQATYSNGKKYVYLTVGQFASTADSKKNFEDQIRGVKGNGGKVTYQNTASDGTISAIYEKGGYYFAEYCNTNNYCNRIHSDNRDALKSFFGSYAKD